MRISPQTARTRRLTGISMVETLVAIAIIATLSALLIPSVARVKEYANAARCISNQRQLFHGLESYANDHDGALPTSMNSSWQNQVAAYLGITIPNGQTPGSPPCNQDVFLCPSVTRDPKPWRSYALNSRAGDKTGNTDDKAVRIAQHSKTALLSDARNTSWLMTVSNISTRHNNNTANVLFFDGHVETLTAAQIAQKISWVFIDGDNP